MRVHRINVEYSPNVTFCWCIITIQVKNGIRLHVVLERYELHFGCCKRKKAGFSLVAIGKTLESFIFFDVIVTIHPKGKCLVRIKNFSATKHVDIDREPKRYQTCLKKSFHNVCRSSHFFQQEKHKICLV